MHIAVINLMDVNTEKNWQPWLENTCVRNVASLVFKAEDDYVLNQFLPPAMYNCVIKSRLLAVLFWTAIYPSLVEV